MYGMNRCEDGQSREDERKKRGGSHRRLAGRERERERERDGYISRVDVRRCTVSVRRVLRTLLHDAVL